MESWLWKEITALVHCRYPNEVLPPRLASSLLARLHWSCKAMSRMDDTWSLHASVRE